MGGLLERPEWKSTKEFTRTGSSCMKQDSGAPRVFCVSRAEQSSIQGREPAAAEEKSGTEGSKKNWSPIRLRFLQCLLKSGMQGRATHGRTKIAGNTRDRKSTRLNSSHSQISYAVFCLKKKKKMQINLIPINKKIKKVTKKK